MHIYYLYEFMSLFTHSYNYLRLKLFIRFFDQFCIVSGSVVSRCCRVPITIFCLPLKCHRFVGNCVHSLLVFNHWTNVICTYTSLHVHFFLY